jgi:hypothetical protein
MSPRASTLRPLLCLRHLRAPRQSVRFTSGGSVGHFSRAHLWRFSRASKQTDSPEFNIQLRREETIIQTLIERLRSAVSTPRATIARSE